MRRVLGTMLAAVVASAALVGGTTTAEAHRHPGPKAGDLLEVSLKQLHPTQSVLGKDEVYYKLGRYGSTKDEQNGDFNKRFDDWCETNGQGVAASVQPGARLDRPSTFTCELPVGSETEDSIKEMKTAVVGPHGQLYLTDGHHTLTSFWESPDGGPRMHIRVRITADFSKLSTRAFWQRMKTENLVWLYDAKNRPISVKDLPGRLGLRQFDDDPYRGLVYFTRDIGYEQLSGDAEFQEFYWGQWLRQSIKPTSKDLTDPAKYLALVQQASAAMVAQPDDAIISGGRTAASLGKLAKVDTKEFGKLSKPITDAKPGKLAYALAYKESLKK